MKKKSCKSIIKRFKQCANSLLKFKHSGMRHLLTKKRTKRKRRLSKCGFLLKTQVRLFKNFM